jgi:hypothetical protein
MTKIDPDVELTRPCVLFQFSLKISLDGNQYCVLYGEDLMSGVAGFGSTMEEAHRDFDLNWLTQKAPTPAKIGKYEDIK